VFSHGWPLKADASDAQMLFLGQHAYRVIAHNRHGHGRSSQPWKGNDIDSYADDLAEPIEALNFKNASGSMNLARFRPSQQKSAQVHFGSAVYSQL
jgi:non-heme chloroperoxidase